MNTIQSLLFAAIASLCFTPLAYGQATVRLCNHLVEANEPIVSLGDVATIQNASPKIQGRLAKLELGTLEEPSTDKVYQLSKRDIALSLQLAGFNRNDFQVQGPDVIQLAYVTESNKVERLEQSIQSWIAETYGIDKVDLQVTVEPKFKANDKFQIPADPEFAPLNQTKLPLGKQNVTMMVRQANQPGVKALAVPVIVELMREVAIAARNIPQGTQISAADIRMVKRPFTSTNQSWFDASQLLKQVARRNIAKYELIDSQMLQNRSQAQKLVRKNALVDALLKHGAFKIQLKNARALGEGNEGDVIEIANPQTGRRFRATITGPNSVEIN